MFIRAYLRASTSEQDANRAKKLLIDFAIGKGHKIASFYIENVSGRKLERPELLRLIEDADEGDVLLIESTDRLTRMVEAEWELLKDMLRSKRINVVVLDLPTSHSALTSDMSDPMTRGIMNAVNAMLLDIMATMASKDYELRRQRSEQGIAIAKDKGRYKGRPVNTKRNAQIAKLITDGHTYTDIQELTGASRVTISKIKKTLV